MVGVLVLLLGGGGCFKCKLLEFKFLACMFDGFTFLPELKFVGLDLEADLVRGKFLLCNLACNFKLA